MVLFGDKSLLLSGMPPDLRLWTLFSLPVRLFELMLELSPFPDDNLFLFSIGPFSVLYI